MFPFLAAFFRQSLGCGTPLPYITFYLALARLLLRKLSFPPDSRQNAPRIIQVGGPGFSPAQIPSEPH